MLGNFLDKAKQGLFDLQTNAKKYRNKDFLNASLAASAMVTVADGSVGAEEKRKAIQFAKTHEGLSIFDTNDVVKTFKDYLDGLDPNDPTADADLAEMGALADIGKVKKNDEHARMVLRLAIAIGNADGTFDEKEREVAIKIARELGLDPADFELS